MKMKRNFLLRVILALLTIHLVPEGNAAVAQKYSVLFYSGRGDNKDVYILHPGEKEPRNLTNHPAQDICPAASPDGKRIAFLSDRSGNMDIYTMEIDGSESGSSPPRRRTRSTPSSPRTGSGSSSSGISRSGPRSGSWTPTERIRNG